MFFPKAQPESRQRFGCLLLALARKKIYRRQFFKCALQTSDRGLRLAGTEFAQSGSHFAHALHQSAIPGAAVKQFPHRFHLTGISEFHLDRHRHAIRRPDLGRHLRQHWRAGRPGRQHINAIAQHAATGFLQCPPDAHADGRIACRQAEDQGIEFNHIVISIT